MAARSKRKVIVRSVAVGFVVIFAWIAVLVASQIARNESHDFRAETQMFMEQLRDGRVHHVYEQASPLFRTRVTLERLQEQADNISATFGRFKGILGTDNNSLKVGRLGKTGRVDARLEFETAKALASLSFHFHDHKWRLLGFEIPVPKNFDPARLPHAKDSAVRRAASKEVQSLVTRILADVRDGKAAAVYEHSAEPFKRSITREMFLSGVAEQQESLGAFNRVLDVITSSDNPALSRARVEAVLEFARARTTGTFEFISVDGEWKLLAFRVKPGGTRPGAKQP